MLTPKREGNGWVQIGSVPLAYRELLSFPQRLYRPRRRLRIRIYHTIHNLTLALNLILLILTPNFTLILRPIRTALLNDVKT